MCLHADLYTYKSSFCYINGIKFNTLCGNLFLFLKKNILMFETMFYVRE